ncbi:MAG: hypothetical protein ACTSQI_06060 [Candidatus Helarchaeota archaeon]
MPKKRKYKRKKTGLELLAAVLVAIGAVLCIVLGVLSFIPDITSISQYAFGIIFQETPIKEVLAIICGIIIIVIEGYNKLDDYWAIIGILILGFLAATIGALLIIIGCFTNFIGFLN